MSVIECGLSSGEKEKEDQLDSTEATEAVHGISCSKLLYKLKAVEKYLQELETGEKTRDVLDVAVAEQELLGDDERENRSVASSTTSTLRGRGKSIAVEGDAGGVVLTEDMKQIVGQLSEICGEVSGSIRERMTSEDADGEEEVAANNRIQELLDKVRRVG